MSEEIQSATVALSLRSLTPARVALGRTGVSLPTRALLSFQLSHAQARDAVHARLESASLAATLAQLSACPILCLHSAAPDRTTYLQRPDLGRILDEPSRALLTNQASANLNFDLALIVADGLSALAVERHVPPLMHELLPLLAAWDLAPITVVEQGRVAIADEIATVLHAQISVILIGERPGLSSPDSLGAYITYDPRPGRTDAERNCISNIRTEGLSYTQAAAQLAFYLTEARRRQLSGVALKDESNLLT
ncbi:MAG: ethanolamine ammonia-lyase subunit EutC [Terracidiphilus sp.]|jgi:ethanolamine ammonia-lyase small subunit